MNSPPFNFDYRNASIKVSVTMPTVYFNTAIGAKGILIINLSKNGLTEH